MGVDSEISVSTEAGSCSNFEAGAAVEFSQHPGIAKRWTVFLLGLFMALSISLGAPFSADASVNGTDVIGDST
ncbi:MAG: hypothetical protein ACOYIK_00785, partial [Coriobacteriales bacterium]